MDINLVFVISIVLITAAILFLVAYCVMLLSHIRKILKPVEKMVSELGDEFKPLLSDVSGITGSLNSFLGRFERISSLVFAKADLVAKGTEQVGSYTRRFVTNPKVEIASIAAGLKKGLEVLLKSRKKGG